MYAFHIRRYGTRRSRKETSLNDNKAVDVSASIEFFHSLY